MSDSLPSGIFVVFGTVFVVIKQCIYRIKKSLLKIAADDPKLGMSLDD